MQLTGLTDSQVLSIRAQYGSNQMPQPQPKSAWYFFKEVFSRQNQCDFIGYDIPVLGLKCVWLWFCIQSDGNWVGCIWFVAVDSACKLYPHIFLQKKKKVFLKE